MLRLRSWLVPAAIAASTTGVMPFLNGCDPTPGSDPPPSAGNTAITVAASQSPTTTAAEVHWTIPSSAPNPARFLVIALANSADLGQVVCSTGTCRSMEIPGLTPGVAYTFLVEESTASGYSAPGISAPLTIADPCTIADACMTVNGSSPGAAVSHSLSGMNQGIDATTPSSLVTPIEPSFWRIGVGPPVCSPYACDDWLNSNLVAPYHPTLINIVSDLWHNVTFLPFQECVNAVLCTALHAPRPTGGAATPWSDWGGYDAFVSDAVKGTVSSGHTIGYWDLVNEPPGAGPAYDGYFDAKDANSLTKTDIEQWLLHTYRDVKGADPGAKIVCPSLEGYMDYPGEEPSSSSLLDMSTFLSFAVANGMHCDAFSWHEINYTPSATDFNNQPADILDHVARFRALLAQYPSLAGAEIFITEYGAPTPPGGSAPYDSMPGWSIGYLAALQAAGVNEGNRSCATSAACGSLLDDLLTSNGTTISPAATYWPYGYYARMTGNWLPVSSSAEQVSGLASLNATTKTLYLLAGRHETQDVGGVATPSSTAPEQVAIQVHVPWSSSQVTVAVQDYADTAGAVSEPPITASTVPVVNGVATITVPLGPEDGVGLAITPS